MSTIIRHVNRSFYRSLSSTRSKMASSSTANPGVVTGHAKLVGGAAEAALGNLTGNDSLKQHGESLKQAGTEELKAYQSSNPADPSSLSTKIGSAAGCEPLQEAESSSSSTLGAAPSSTGSISASSGVGGVIKDDGSVNSGLKDILSGGDQPGKPTGGAEGASGTRAEVPERLV